MPRKRKQTLLFREGAAAMLASGDVVLSVKLSQEQRHLVEQITGRQIAGLDLTANEISCCLIKDGKPARTGIVCALPGEAAILCAQLTDHSFERRSFRQFDVGKLAGVPVVITVAGTGKVNAALTAETMCSLFTIGQMIVTGVAGGLASLPIGSIVIARYVAYHDFGQLTEQWVRRGPIEVKFPPCESSLVLWQFDSDPTLVSLLADAARRIDIGEHPPGLPAETPELAVAAIATGDQFVSAAKDRELIRNETGCVAVDMETAAIAHVAFLNQVPFVAVRSLTDRAGISIPVDFNKLAQWAADRSARVVQHFVESAGARKMKPTLVSKGGLGSSVEYRPVVLEIPVNDAQRTVLHKAVGMQPSELALSSAELLRIVAPDTQAAAHAVGQKQPGSSGSRVGDSRGSRRGKHAWMPPWSDRYGRKAVGARRR
jgi:adenosylhomocysteine nucleosidase